MRITASLILWTQFSISHKLFVTELSLLDLLFALLACPLALAAMLGGNEDGVVLAGVRGGECVGSTGRDEAICHRVCEAQACFETAEFLADGVSRKRAATVSIWDLKTFLKGKRIRREI